ncbi:hypothetical protein HYH03_014130 [Edaphochlamys debaryana]|uniref:Uncharacterized protein n=1 Tax=Edaphochlamys debaryana TaxID=47281 RepID=A0A835XPJ5_9CHLO|nr:hypothetical protein HYH03_014130 [Edaphochlamys debaryana]|eukprot:KAG2487290.1 hypothetical protein HYH03_014130 [Edaphochlamys debaryana]
MAAAATASSFFSESSSQVPGHSLASSVPSEASASHRNGFRGMFKVPSLVFDIELEDNGIGAQWDDGDWEEDEVVTEIQRFVQPTSSAEARLLSDVRVACQHAKDGQDTTKLVAILSALGYRCSLRTALGGGDGADCLRNLRHTFITCDTPSVNGAPARRYIVDPQFKEQFIIAKTTARYAAILAAIPQVFVGPEEHLALLVNFLCTEMSTAFRQLGSVLPPWRHASSVLSKWRPRKSVDESMAAAARNPLLAVVATGAENGAPMGASIAAAVSGAGGIACGARATCGAPLQPHNPPQQQQQAALRAAFANQPFGTQPPMPHLPMGAMPITGSRRQSFEPQRVVFGGNFIPIGLTPAPAC